MNRRKFAGTVVAIFAGVVGLSRHVMPTRAQLKEACRLRFHGAHVTFNPHIETERVHWTRGIGWELHPSHRGAYVERNPR